VNISSRLEGMNKVYGTDIIISEYTRNQCKDSFEFRRLDRVSVIGRRKGFEIYELIALKDDINKSLKKLFQYYEIGLQYYFDRKWDEGLKYFNAILKYRPNDTPSKLMRDRCLLYKQIPPPQDWGGVSVQPYK
jgi:adenylate cyclase